MLINSNFKDYYDSLSVYGIDKSIVYNRKTQIIRDEKEYKNFISKYNLPNLKRLSITLYNNNTRRIERISYANIIIFAGKLYPYYVVNKNDQDYICYDKESFQNIMRDKYKKYYDKLFSKPKKKLYFREYHTYHIINELYDLNDIEIEIEYPIVLVKYDSYIINPILREINFQKRLDPYMTRQLLEQWFIKQGVNNQPSQNISDEDMRDMKGFNKCSFKKCKEK